MPDNPPGNTLCQPQLQGWLENQHTLTVHWVTKEGSLFTVSLSLDPGVQQNPQPEILHTGKRALGIHGCIERRLTGRKLISLWDSLEDSWFERGHLPNPVAAFLLEGSEILLVDANGTLKRVPLRATLTK